MLELIYFTSVLVGLVDMLTSDYESERLKALKRNMNISEWELLLVKTIMAFIPILNTYMGINFIYKFLNKK